MDCAELSAGLAISSQHLCAVFCQDWVSGGVTYRGMDATDLDSSENSQDHSVRTFPVVAQSLLLTMVHPDQACWLVIMRFNRWQINRTGSRAMETVGSESFVTPVLTGVRQN